MLQETSLHVWELILKYFHVLTLRLLRQETRRKHQQEVGLVEHFWQQQLQEYAVIQK